jgi:hypothetical protein
MATIIRIHTAAIMRPTITFLFVVHLQSQEKQPATADNRYQSFITSFLKVPLEDDPFLLLAEFLLLFRLELQVESVIEMELHPK